MNQRASDFSSALKMAIDFEKEGRDYYLSARDKCSHPLGKQMFKSLADDEVGHIKRIKILFESLADQGEWPQKLPLPRTQIKTVFKEAMANIDKDVKGDEDDLVVIDRALELEKKGFEFYRDMAQKSTRQDEKDFFGSLAGEESVHMDILNTTHEYLEHPWDFFAGEERPIFEG